MAESLLNHGSPDLRREDMASLAARAAEEPVAGGFRTLSTYRRGRAGALYALHFWAYPAATLPARLLLRLFRLDEHKAFALTNALVLLGALRLWLWHAPWPRAWRLLAAGLLLVSPVGWFATLPHPEAFSASLLAAGLLWWRTGAPGRATLAAALAAMQNPPLSVLAGVLAGSWLWRSRPLRARTVLLCAAALSPAVLPFAFNLWAFGTPSLIADENVHLSLLSPRRALELLLDLNIGLLPYAPFTVLLALGAGAAVLLRPGARARVLAAGGLFLTMGLACSGMADWNHGTSGPSRYAVWLFPLVVAAAVEACVGLGWRRLGAAAALALAAQAAVFVGHGGLRPPEDYLRHSWLARLVLARAPALYAPTPEIFAERTAGQDRPAGGPFVLVMEGRCRKALAQKRHAEELRRRCGPEPAAFTAFRDTVRDTDRGRQQWVYVDY